MKFYLVQRIRAADKIVTQWTSAATEVAGDFVNLGQLCALA